MSDQLGDVEDAYIIRLKALKAQSLDNAQAAVSALVKRLRDLDFDVAFTPFEEEEEEEEEVRLSS